MVTSFKKPLFSLLFSLQALLGFTDVIVMNPEPDSEVSGENLLIAASFIGINNVDPGRIRLIVDGNDFTEESFIDNDMLTCLIDFMEPGTHKIDLFVLDMAEPISWEFTSTSIENPIKYSGRIKSSSSLDQIDDQNLSINKLNIDFSGSAMDWLTFNSSIKVTSQENQLYQSRNVYGFNFGINEIFNFRIGDSNPRISHYTLNGKRIRGLEFGLNYKWLSIKYVKGELNRAVQGSIDNAYSYTVKTDTSGSKYLALDRSGYTFKQNLSTFRLALGEGDKFQLGLNLLKARDDTSSVNYRINDAQIYYEPTSLGSVDGLDSGKVYSLSQLDDKAKIIDPQNWSGIGPKDNIVLSSDMGINLFSKRLRLDGEVAFSMTNNNIWGGPITLAGLDTLVDDSVDSSLSSFDLSDFPDPSDYEKYIIINSNLAPLVPIDINAFGDSSTISITDAIFSMPSLAYRGRMVTNFFGNYLAVEYSQIGSEFNSLANPYLVKNKRGWSITDKIKLFQNRLMLSLAYKYYDDNILTTVENVTSQSDLTLGVNAIPGPELPTFNMSFRVTDRDNGIKNITVLNDNNIIDNREQTFTDNFMLNINHRFNLMWEHSLSGTYVMISKKDNYFDRAQDFVDPSMATNVINMSIKTRYNSPLETTVNITSNESELSTGPGTRGNQNFLTTNLLVQYPFLGNKILARGGLSLASGSGMVETSWVGLKSGLRWKILDDFGLNTHVEFRSKETAGVTKSSVIARFNLEYSF